MKQKEIVEQQCKKKKRRIQFRKKLLDCQRVFVEDVKEERNNNVWNLGSV